MAILLAGLTSIFYGVFDFAGGMATRRAPVFAVAFWSNIIALALSGLVAFLYHMAFGSAVSLSDLAWGAASGVAGVAGVVAYYEGLGEGPDGGGCSGIRHHPVIDPVHVRVADRRTLCPVAVDRGCPRRPCDVAHRCDRDP